MKRLFCVLSVLALVVGAASAQRLSPTIIDQQVARPTGMTRNLVSPLQPSYCSPCLFYSGDSDPNNPNANGLWDNNSSYFGINGVIYTPFQVNAKKGWNVTGLGGNIEMYPSPPTLAGQDWSIVTGVAAGGTPGTTTVLCSGTDSSPVITDTGRLFFGLYEEFNVASHVSGCPVLKRGKKKHPTIYWQTNPVDTSTLQLAYESNVPDSPPPGACGPAAPLDQSFFYGPSFGVSTFTNANQEGDFHIFSYDVEGTGGSC